MSEASSISVGRFRQSLRGAGFVGVTVFVGICVASIFFTPAAAALVLLWAWASGTSWREIGLVRPDNWLGGLVLGIALGVTEKILLKAIVLPLLGAPAVNGTLGDLASNPKHAWFLVFYVIFGAGFCEELVFRGYLFQRLGTLVGRGKFARAISIVLATTFFASLHYQQGLFGIVNAAIAGGIAGIVYFVNRMRLWTLIVAHATFDLSAIALNFFHLEGALAHVFFWTGSVS